MLEYDASKNPLGIPAANIAKKDLPLKNLEFKRSLDDLLAEFDKGIKKHRQVRFAVVWDEGDTKQERYELLNLLEGSGYQRRYFHGQTHTLIIDAHELPVISLKAVISVLKSSGILN